MMNSVEPPPMSMTRRGSSRRRQHVRDAEVDEPRFLVAGDDVDREAERALGLRQERRRRSSRRAACWSRRRAPPTGAAPQALAEAGEAGERRARAPPACRLPLASMPAPRRSVSRQVSSRKIWSPSTRPISSRKLFDPMSTTASVVAVSGGARHDAARVADSGGRDRHARGRRGRDRTISCYARELPSIASASPWPSTTCRRSSPPRVYDVADRDAARARADAVARASATACCSSARTSSRCSRSSCAAPTTRWRT